MASVFEGKPQLPPGFCFICEQSNDCRYVDTFRDFEGVVREKLDGRKYVCEGCVSTFARELGYHAPEVLESAHHELAAAQATVDELVKKLEAFKALEDSIKVLSAPKAPARKPPAKPKAA